MAVQQLLIISLPHKLQWQKCSNARNDDPLGMCREWLAGRDTADNTTASQEIVQLSSGHVTVNVSTGTGRLLSLTSQAGLLSAELSSEVHLVLCVPRDFVCAQRCRAWLGVTMIHHCSFFAQSMHLEH